MFQNHDINPKEAINRASRLQARFNRARDSLANNQQIRERRNARQVTWKPLPEDCVKANVNASVSKERGIGWRGNSVTGTAKRTMINSCIAVQAHAFREAAIMVKNLNIDKALTTCLKTFHDID
ncbi:hypothetical protein Ahy_B06g083029 isoform C [Arachis hypogaea]|uniref:Uncharacterized protein n=1 Tax=Arachis hypogaea TaxID=3818 RepID=A0A444YPC1_ARAHY|nr:hypothetical protein Ahy_B06g083029 isoform C [Arachis hypogaea]